MSFLRTACRSSFLRISRPIVLAQPRTVFSTGAIRFYSAESGLSRSDIEKRIIDILKGFDKVQNPEKLSATSSFSQDLGLDSLDTVEVVMAIEEEFSLEIPDKDADAIQSVGDAIKYIEEHAEAL